MNVAASARAPRMNAVAPRMNARATTHALSSSSGRPAPHHPHNNNNNHRARFVSAASASKKKDPATTTATSSKRTLADNLSFEDGVFAPAVRIAIAFVGLKDLNKLRGKAIALHSQVITSFCKQVGAPPKTKQGLIRLAKKNGHKLGFLVTEPAW